MSGQKPTNNTGTQQQQKPPQRPDFEAIAEGMAAHSKAVQQYWKTIRRAREQIR